MMQSIVTTNLGQNSETAAVIGFLARHYEIKYCHSPCVRRRHPHLIKVYLLALYLFYFINLFSKQLNKVENIIQHILSY